MTLDELMRQVLLILPNAVFDEREGEVVISTGMSLVEQSKLVPVEEAVFGSGYNE